MPTKTHQRLELLASNRSTTKGYPTCMIQKALEGPISFHQFLEVAYLPIYPKFLIHLFPNCMLLLFFGSFSPRFNHHRNPPLPPAEMLLLGWAWFVVHPLA